ncbi:MAG: toprim domain-containing protein [Acidimicrobiales bacterium]
MIARAPSLIDGALARHNLAEVARRTSIPLSAETGTVTVRCPLPSMRLYLDDNRYHCFGCGAKGDVIQWVRDAGGLGGAQAVRALDSGRPIPNAWAGAPIEGRHRTRPTAASGASGGHLPAELPDLARTPLDRVRRVLQAAWAIYSGGALHERGVAYLAGRGIDVGLLEARYRRAEVGHTPGAPDGLVAASRAAGYNDDELVDAGLAQRTPGQRVTDFYSQGVLVPVREPGGRLAGLIDRNIGDPWFAKYKNPPITHAYDKSINLYLPLPAPAALDGQVVVVEGTFDAMAIAVAAIGAGVDHEFCPVTQSGRELSPAQLEHVLALHAGPPVIGFDGDAPGREANVRLAAAVAARGRRVLLAMLPDGEDPASWLAARGSAGLAAWTRSGCHDSPPGDVRPALADKLIAARLAATASRRFATSPAHAQGLAVTAVPSVDAGMGL